MRLCNECHPAADCEGFAHRSVTSAPARKAAQGGAKSRKLSEFQDQAYPAYVVPEFRVLAAESWPTLMNLLGPEN